MNNIQANIVNSREFADKIYKKLEPTGWNTVLRMFIKSNDFVELLDKLQLEVQSGNRFTPTFKYVFKAFEECHYNDVRVVIVGQDPYPQINVADGLAFSCSRQNRTEKSLQYIHSAIQKTVDNPQPSVQNLQYLADQGVLLLNTALTTQIGKPGTHQDYWKYFMAHLFNELSINKPNLVYLLLGKKAEQWEDLIDNESNVIKASHPASAAYAKQHEWDCNDCFNKVNEILASQELPSINW
jgi:uracil-DNA glycosylase